MSLLTGPKTVEGLQFNYLTEKTPSHTMVTRVRRRDRGGPGGLQQKNQARTAAPPRGVDKRGSQIPAYATMPRTSLAQSSDGTLTPTGDGIKAYPTLERSKTPKLQRANTLDQNPRQPYDRYNRPTSLAAPYPTMEKKSKPQRPLSQGDILDQPDRPPSRSDFLDYVDKPDADDLKGYPKMERPRSRTSSLSKERRPMNYRDLGPQAMPPVRTTNSQPQQQIPQYNPTTKSAPQRIPTAKSAPYQAPTAKNVPGQIPVRVVPSSNLETSPGKPPVPRRVEPAPRKLTDDPSYATVKKRDDRPPSAPYKTSPDRMSPDKGKPPIGRPSSGMGSHIPTASHSPQSRPSEQPRYNPDALKSQTIPGYGRSLSEQPKPLAPVKQQPKPQTQPQPQYADVHYRPKQNPAQGKKSRPKSEIVVTLSKPSTPTSPLYIPKTPPPLISLDEDDEELKMADPRYTPRSSFAYRSLPSRSRHNPRASWSPATGSGQRPVRQSYSPGPPVKPQSSAFRTVGTPRRLGTVR